jgi:hypothetical protein
MIYGSLFLWSQNAYGQLFETRFNPPNLGMAYMAITGEDLHQSATGGFLMYKKYDSPWDEERKVARELIGITKLAITLINCMILMGMIKSLQVDAFAPLAIVYIFTLYSGNMFLDLMDRAILGLVTAKTMDESINYTARRKPAVIEKLNQLCPYGFDDDCQADGGQKGPNYYNI